MELQIEFTMAAFSLNIAAGAALILAVVFHRVYVSCRIGSVRLPPGPKPWRIIGKLARMGGAAPHQFLAAMAREYGPLMHLRLGCVDAVVASSGSVAEQLLKLHDTNFLNRPPNPSAKYIAYNYQDLVLAPYGPRWRMLRKITTLHLFSAKALDQYRSVREEEVGVLVRALARSNKEGAPVKLENLLNICNTNAIGRVVLGRRVFRDGNGADEFKLMVEEALVLAGKVSIGNFIPALQWLDLHGLARKMKNLHKRFDAFLTEIVEEHKALSVGCCLLSTILSPMDQNRDENEDMRLTHTEIKALLMDMFIAGTDTSSSTVEWAIAELIRQPKIMAQVQQELNMVVGHDRLISDSDIPQLTYLQAVVKETLRLHPPIAFIPRKASKSCKINGYLIPKNSFLFVNIWAIGRDPIVWTDPLEFRPERFLPGGEKTHVDVKGSDFEMIPFGIGRRICAGKNLGLRMVQLLIATLAHGFDWDLADGLLAEKLNMEEAYALALRRAQPLIVHPRLRMSPRVYET